MGVGWGREFRLEHKRVPPKYIEELRNFTKGKKVPAEPREFELLDYDFSLLHWNVQITSVKIIPQRRKSAFAIFKR